MSLHYQYAPTLTKEAIYCEIQYTHKVKVSIFNEKTADNAVKAFDYYKNAAYEECKKLIATGANHIVLTGLFTMLEKRATLIGALKARAEANLPYYKCPIICHITNFDRPRSKHIHLDMDPVETSILEDKIQTLLVTLESIGADGFIFTSSSASQVTKFMNIARQVTHKPIAFISRSTNMVLEAESFLAFDPKELGPTPSKSKVEAFLKKMQELNGGERFIIFTLHEFNQEFWDHKNKLSPMMALTHANCLVPLGPKEHPVIVGERINPYYFEQVLPVNKDHSFNENEIPYLVRQAIAQKNAGANIININLGYLENIDNVQEMSRLFTELVYQISHKVHAALSIDCTNPDILEPLLKIYPGRLLINSVAAIQSRMNAILPLAKKYGAAVVCMPVNNTGVPKRSNDRCVLTKDIKLSAETFGLTERDLVLDPIVLPAKYHREGAIETIKTMRLYQDSFDCPIIMGLSNISSSVEDKLERSHINREFLTMCLSNGLNAVIMDPNDWDVRDTFYRISELLGFKKTAGDIKIYKLKK